MKQVDDSKCVLREAGAWCCGDPIPPDLHDREIVDLFVRLATDLTTPARHHRAAHQVREGRLSQPVYWRGRQWAVTAYGIECRERQYWIEHRRIWEDEERHGWVRHLAIKNWVDLADFAEALRIARMRWPHKKGA